MTGTSHKRAVSVWDVPATVDRGEFFSVKVGIKCPAECAPDGWELQVKDHQERIQSTQCVRPEAWPGTSALSGAAFELTAPAETGLFEWSVVAAADDIASGHADPLHDAVSARFNVRVVPAAELRLTVVAIDRETGSAVSGARVVAHPYRAKTDAAGIAVLQLPRGAYRLFVSRQAFLPLRLEGEFAEDTTLRAELLPDREPPAAEVWS
jgi:hypothetical protein